VTAVNENPHLLICLIFANHNVAVISAAYAAVDPANIKTEVRPMRITTVLTTIPAAAATRGRRIPANRSTAKRAVLQPEWNLMKIILTGLTTAAIVLPIPPAHAAPYFTQNSFDRLTVNNGEVTAQGAAHCENPAVAPNNLTISATDPSPSGKIGTANLDSTRTQVLGVMISTPDGPKIWTYRPDTPGVRGIPGSAAVTKAANGGFAVVGMVSPTQPGGIATIGSPVPFEIDVVC
jgi:hypothetical protein